MQADIDSLNKKLIEQASLQMRDIIRQQFDVPDTILLYFESLFSVDIRSFSSLHKP
jgi:hypothetical protein